MTDLRDRIISILMESDGKSTYGAIADRILEEFKQRTKKPKEKIEPKTRVRKQKRKRNK
jgi:hypothetical protein